MKLPTLITALQKSWDKNTSYYKNWTPDNPAYGQCAVTALVVQDYFGGEIIRCKVGAYSHYYNEINGRVHDLTVSQFNRHPVIYKDCVLSSREQLLSNSLTSLRYELLAEKVRGKLE